MSAPSEDLQINLGIQRMEYEFAVSALKAAHAHAQELRAIVEDALQALFSGMLRDTIAQQGSFSLDDAIRMGVPCVDCLMLVTPSTRPVHVFSLRSPREEGGGWAADAQCGYRMEAVA